MNEIVIQRAVESDRTDVTQTLVYGFITDFIRLSKNLDIVVSALESSIDISRFFIARDGDRTLGVIACADCNSRAININLAHFRKHLGFAKGTIAGRLMTAEFSKQLHYPLTTGYIEVISVAENYRQMGLASKLLDTVIEQTEYNDYILDVVDSNTAARKCYLKFGFVEIERVSVSLSRLKGFNAKIYMKYCKQNVERKD